VRGKFDRLDLPTVTHRVDPNAVSPMVADESMNASFIASETVRGGSQCKPDESGCATQVSAEVKDGSGDRPPSRDRQSGGKTAVGGKAKRKLLTLEKYDGPDTGTVANWQAPTTDSAIGWPPYPQGGQRFYHADNRDARANVQPPQSVNQYSGPGYNQNAANGFFIHSKTFENLD